VIVQIHWGDEYADDPAYTQVHAAHAMIEAGADLVIGHHPHVLQGFELHEGGFIAYSLGNFLFENTNDPARLTGVLRVRFKGSRACLDEIRFHPAYVTRLPVQHPVPARGYMGRKVRARVRQVSKRFDAEWTDDEHDMLLTTPPC
jgi:poly-gamma-glutamate synthesis protein (capsule biosynthesis protein)